MEPSDVQAFPKRLSSVRQRGRLPANRNREAFFVPGTDTQIGADGLILDMAAGPSAADWSYDPDLGGHRRNWRSCLREGTKPEPRCG